MVAIVSGKSLGLLTGSAAVLGERGMFGQAITGNRQDGLFLNAATGNLVMQGRDDFLASNGLDLAITRTYNSQGTLNGMEQGSWSVGPLKSVALNGDFDAPGSSVIRTDSDGSQSLYARVGPGVYRSTDGDGAFDTLSSADGGATWTWVDGATAVTEVYDGTSAGRLVTSTDRDNNITQYRYDATTGLMSEVEDASHEITFLEHSNGNLTGVRTELHVPGMPVTSSRRVQYAYDGLGRLERVITDLTPDVGTDNYNGNDLNPNVYVSRYTYDGGSSRVASVTQSDGTAVAFSYVYAWGHWRVHTVTDGENRVTSFNYDNPLRTVMTDPLGHETGFQFDGAGQLTRVTTWSGSGAVMASDYQYDAQGNVKTITSPAGVVTRREYDERGNVILETVADGTLARRSFQYDASNQLVSETTYLEGWDVPLLTNDGPPAPTFPDPVVPPPIKGGSFVAPSATVDSTPMSSTVLSPSYDPNTRLTSHFVRDAQGHLRFQISAEGKIVEFVYDAAGNRKSSLAYLDKLWDNQDPMFGNGGPSDLAAVLNWKSSAGANAKLNRTDYIYDFRGQLASSTNFNLLDAAANGVFDGLETTTAITYDAAGQLVQTIRSNGDGTTSLATNSYDGMGRLLTSLDSLGTTLIHYDAANSQISTTFKDGLVTTATYDRSGRLVSEFSPEPGSGQLGKTRYSYDAAGRLRMTEAADGNFSYVLYDDAGRKVADIDGNGSLTEYRYNADGQVLRSIAYSTQVDVELLGNANGSPAEITLQTLTSGLAVEGMDRSNWNRYDAAGHLVKSVDSLGYVTVFAYDMASRLVSSTQYANSIDPGTADLVSDVLPVASSDDRQTYRYYGNDGELSGTLDARGFLTEYRYDIAGKLVRKLAYATPSIPNPALHYVGGNLPLPDSLGAAVEQYAYDRQGRMIQAIDAENFLTAYAYDRNGNLQTSRRYATPVSYGANGTFTFQASVDDQIRSYTYTKVDQVATETDVDGSVTTHAYDSMGRLVTSTRAAGSVDARTATVRYDAHGRVSAQLSAAGADLLAANPDLLPSQVQTIWNQYSVRYTYDQAGLRTSMTDQDGNRSVFYYDAAGRLFATINSDGEVEQRDYNAFNQVSQITRFATHVPPVIALMLTGTEPGSNISQMLASRADAAHDRVTVYQYGQVGELVYQEDSSGGHDMGYNAFRELNSKSDYAAGLDTSLTYDRSGRLLTRETNSRRSPSALEEHEYDFMGNETLRSVDGIAARTEFDKLGRPVLRAGSLTPAARTAYDAFGRITLQTDATEHQTHFDYSTQQRRMTITTPEGVVTTVVNNRLVQQQSVTVGNATTTYHYDHDGQLLSVSDALGTVQASHYDLAGRVDVVTDGNGVETQFTYDVAGRVLTRIVDPTGLHLQTTYMYDGIGQVLKVTSPSGMVTKSEYDDQGNVRVLTEDTEGLRLITLYEYDGRGLATRVTNPAGVVTKYSYDEFGRRLSQTVDAEDLAQLTSFAYDTAGNVRSRTDANGYVTRFYHDANNRLTFAVDPTGAVTGYSYDGNDRLVKTTKFFQTVSVDALPDGSHPIADDAIAAGLSDPSKDNVVNNIYDADGRLRYTVDGTGAVSERVYDAQNRVASTIAYSGRIPVAIVLDTAPVTLAGVGSTPGGVVPAAMNGGTFVGTGYTLASVEAAVAKVADIQRDAVTRLSYDARGRVATSTNGTGGVTSYRYDGDGHVTAVTGRLSADGVDVTAQRMNYDAAGRLVGGAQALSIDAAGNPTSWSIMRQRFDAAGNVIERTAYASPLNQPAPAPNASAAEVAAWLDQVSRAPALDQQARFVFDAANRLVASATAQHMGTDGFMQWSVVTQTFDALGNLLVRDAHADLLSAASLGAEPSQQAVEQWLRLPALDLARDSITQMVYDAANRVRFTVDAIGAVQESRYDGVGNVLWHNQFDALVEVSAAPMSLASLEAGTPETVPFDRRHTTIYTYDQENRVTRIDNDNIYEDRDYDAFGNLTSVNKRGRSEHYYYDVDSRLRFVVDAERQIKETAYDGIGRVTRTVQYKTDSQLAFNVSERIGASTPPEAGSRTTRYEHDAAGNVVSTTDALLFTEYFEYDGLGRKVAFVNKLLARWTYEYDAAGHLAAEHSPSVLVADADGVETPVAMVTRMQYDAFGNVRSRTEAAGLAGAERTTTYEYDLVGRQTKTTFPPVAVYDASQETHSVTDTLAFETTAGGGASTTVLYDALGHATTNIDALGNISRKLYDRRGEVQYEIDPLGYMTGYQYDAYGNITKLTHYADTVFASTNRIQLAQLYTILLGRGVDAEGLAFWGPVLRAGSSFAEVAEGMLASPETQQYYPAGAGAAAFVSQMFNMALGRQPTSAELDHYGALFATPGVARGAVIDAFVHGISQAADLRAFNAKLDAVLPDSSDQPLQVMVTEVYAALFDRAPTPAEFVAGLRLLQLRVPHVQQPREAQTELIEQVLQTAEGRERYPLADDAPTFFGRLTQAMLHHSPAWDMAGIIQDVDYYSRAVAVSELIETVGRYSANPADRAMFAAKVAANGGLAPVAAFGVNGWSADAVRDALARSANPQDRTIEMTYNQRNLLLTKQESEGSYHQAEGAWPEQDIASYAASRETTNRYDDFGELIEQRVGTSNGGPIAITRFAYNGRGEKTAQLVSAEYHPVWAYDSGLDASKVSSGGYLTTMKYDAAGSLTDVYEYATQIPDDNRWGSDWAAFDENPNQAWVDLLASVQPDASDRHTENGYDLDNRKTSQTLLNAQVDSVSGTTPTQGRLNVVTGYEYDKVGNLASTTDALGGVTYNFYDAIGRVSAVASRAAYDASALADLNLASAADPVPISLTAFKRDIYGNVLRSIAYKNGTTATDVSGPNGAPAPAAPSEEDRTTVTVYNLNGNAISITDAEGKTSYASYDKLGRVAKQWQNVTQLNTGVLEGESAATAFKIYHYDANGQIDEVLTPGTSTTVTPTNPLRVGAWHSSTLVQISETDWAWSGENSVSVIYPPMPPQAKEISVKLTYSVAGSAELQTKTMPGGRSSATFKWVDELSAQGGIEQVVSVEVTYKDTDGVLHLAQADNAQLFALGHLDELPFGSVNLKHQTNEYNAFGEVISRSQDGVKYEYSLYDKAGNVWRTNAGDGIDKIFEYNTAGQIAQVIRSADTTPGSPGNLTSYDTYEAFLQASYLINSSLEKTETLYDLMGRVVVQRSGASVVTEAAEPRSVFTPQITMLKNGTSTYWATNIKGYGGRWVGSNTARVDFVLPENLGNGDIKVELAYTTVGGGGDPLEDPQPAGGPQTYQQIFSQDQLTVDQLGQWNATLKWNQAQPLAGAHIDGIRISIKDANGEWKLMSKVDSPPEGKPIAMIQKTGGPFMKIGAGVTVQYRHIGGETYLPLTGIDLGDATLFDLAALEGGNYEFIATLGSGETYEMGQFSVFAAANVNNYIKLGYDYLPVPAQVNRRSVYQRNDRWGNPVEITDPRNPNWSTRYQYNSFNRRIGEQVIRASVSATGERTEITRTSTAAYYDALGRQIASSDANGNVNRQFYEQHGKLGYELNAENGLLISSYDLFGERTQLTQKMSTGPDIVTNYAYDHLGQVAESWVDDVMTFVLDSITDGSGMNAEYGQQVRLAQHYRYDELGRRISSTNSAGGETRTRYDLDGNVVAVGDATRIVVRYAYDAFHRKVLETDARDKSKSWQYYPDGKLRVYTDLGGATMHYEYNGLGQKIWQTSSGRGSAGIEQDVKYTYDRAGLLTRIDDLSAKQVTTYSYDLLGNRISEKTVQTQLLQVQGSQAFPDDEVAQQVAAFYILLLGRAPELSGLSFWISSHNEFGNSFTAVAEQFFSSPETQVKFAPDLSHSEFVTTLFSVALGRNPDTETAQWYFDKLEAGGTRGEAVMDLIAELTDTERSTLNDKVYAALHPTAAGGAVRSLKVQNNHITYDDLGRMSRVVDGRYQVSFSYDKNGNRTEVDTKYVDDKGNPVRTDVFNTYDKMNRQLMVNAENLGSAADPVLSIGKFGHQLTYDSAGNRKTDMFRFRPDDAGSVVTDSYDYDNAGRLTNTSRDGWIIDMRKYDSAGRLAQSGAATSMGTEYRTVLKQWDMAADFRTFAYDAEGRVLRQKERDVNGDAHNDIYYMPNGDFPDVGYDEAGHLKGYFVVPPGSHMDRQYHYTMQYAYFDDYRQAGVTVTVQHDNLNRTTSSEYDQNGYLVRVSAPEVSSAAGTELATERVFINDAFGHVLRAKSGKDVTHSLVVNGELLGSTGGSGAGETAGIFANTYQPAREAVAASAPFVYIVQSASETLQGIAKAVWGDSQLWYLIADANGLGGGELSVGMALQMPARVNTLHNDYQTYRPYDRSKLDGDLTPKLPPLTGQDSRCSPVFGQIVAIIVAIVVTIYAGPQYGAIAGNIAGQAVNIADGAQEEFSWKSVALTAVSAGVTPGVDIGGNVVASAAVNAAIGNAMTQGVAILIHAQDHFDWRGVVASAAGGAVSASINGIGVDSKFAQVARGAFASFAGGITASLARGGRVSVQQIAADAFGNALGSSLAKLSSPEQALLSQAGVDILNGERFAANDQVRDPANFRQQDDVLRLDAGSPNGKDSQSDVYSFISKYMDAHPDLQVDSNSIDAAQTAYDRTKLTSAQLSAEAAGAGPLTAEWAGLRMSNSPVTDGIYASSNADGNADLYTPTRSVIGDAYRFSMHEALDSSNSWSNRAGYGAAALITALPGLLNDAASGFLNSPNDLVGGSKVMADGWAASDPYRFSAGLMRASTGLLNLAGGTSVLNGGVVANQAASEYAVSNASARLTYGASIAVDTQAAFRTNFVGPTIGRSGFLSTEELSDAVFSKYQAFVDDGHAAVQRAEAAGLLKFPENIHPDTYKGQLVDGAARDNMRAWLNQENIPEGVNGLVQLNRRLYAPSGGSYRIPDVRIPSTGDIYDATLGQKWLQTPQVQDFRNYSPAGNITIVRPTPLGGSYGIR